MTSGSYRFDQAVSECAKINSTFARIVSPTELNNAHSAIVKAGRSRSYVSFALAKTAIFLTYVTSPCFSTYDNDVIKQRLKWMVGNESRVDELPWKYTSFGNGNLSMGSCQRTCFRLHQYLRKTTGPSLQDMSCHSRRHAICSGGECHVRILERELKLLFWGHYFKKYTIDALRL